jgi:hypothetical protein
MKILSPAAGLRSTRCQADSIQLPSPEGVCPRAIIGGAAGRQLESSVLRSRGASLTSGREAESTGRLVNLQDPGHPASDQWPPCLGRRTHDRAGEMRLSFSNLHLLSKKSKKACPMLLCEKKLPWSSHLNAMLLDKIQTSNRPPMAS